MLPRRRHEEIVSVFGLDLQTLESHRDQLMHQGQFLDDLKLQMLTEGLIIVLALGPALLLQGHAEIVRLHRVDLSHYNACKRISGNHLSVTGFQKALALLFQRHGRYR